VYIPSHFEEHDTGVLHALVRAHPLGAWVVQAEGRLEVNHIPFLVDETRGEHGTLVGHVARSNPVWRALPTPAESVVIFQGPQAYISPSWYPSKAAHGKVVPTWNYAVVHAHGAPRAIEDRDWLLSLVTKLTDTHEAERAAPWQVTDAPADYVETMLKAIVGIEIPLTKLEGKWKTSQNRLAGDKLGTIAGLHARGDEAAAEMAALVERHSGRK
jgi:transcriptional regulator